MPNETQGPTTRRTLTAAELANCYYVESAVKAGNWEWLAGYIYGRFGVAVAAGWCEQACDGCRPCYWSDGSWAAWWKCRLIEAGHWPPGECEPPAVRFGTPIHGGFLSVPETDEHLRRLRTVEPTQVPGAPILAVPGIRYTLEKPTPINRVAARVANVFKNPPLPRKRKDSDAG